MVEPSKLFRHWLGVPAGPVSIAGHYTYWLFGAVVKTSI